MRFLVVDDDITICHGTARRLENMNHPAIAGVSVSFSGEEALTFLAAHSVDVLFTDIRMNEMDGLELIEKAKACNPSLLCVVISAHDDFAYAKRAIRLGVEEFLVKPCSLEDMRMVTLNVIKRYEEGVAHRRLQLDTALDELLAGKPGGIRALFHAHGIDVPSPPLRVIAWEREQMAWPDALWVYPLRRRPAGLCALPDEGAEERLLQSVCDKAGASVGISLPDLPIGTMLSQAQEALQTAWFWETPTAVLWRGYTMSAYKAMEDSLTRDVKLFRAGSVRSSLYHLVALAAGDAPFVLTGLLPRLVAVLTAECLQNDLAAPALLLPGSPLGWQRAVETCVQNIRALRLELTQQSTMNPIPFAKRYMREHLQENLTMGTVANLLDMSYSHFSRVFHEQTGETFQEHLLALRMEEACRMLRNGLRVNYIAGALGYQSANNFTRSFTKYHGLSPGRWRQTQLRDASPAARGKMPE